jgi:uncharacterized protein YciI
MSIAGDHSDRTIGMGIFHVVVIRTGPSWRAGRPLEEQSGWAEHAAFMEGLVDAGFIILGGPLADEHRVVHVVEAESDAAVLATLARDPWSETHLRVESVEPWTIRLDGRIRRRRSEANAEADRGARADDVGG